MPIVGTKVIVDNKYPGFILKVFPPNECHSGRFIVQVHFKYYTDNIEFWFSDYGVSVKESKKCLRSFCRKQGCNGNTAKVKLNLQEEVIWYVYAKNNGYNNDCVDYIFYNRFCNVYKDND